MGGAKRIYISCISAWFLQWAVYYKLVYWHSGSSADMCAGRIGAAIGWVTGVYTTCMDRHRTDPLRLLLDAVSIMICISFVTLQLWVDALLDASWCLCVCDTDNKDGVAAAAAAADIDGRLWRLHCSRSCLAADQRRSCSACGHTRLCTYRNPPTRTIPKHQVCPSAVFFKVLKITLQFNKLENSQGEGFLFFLFFYSAQRGLQCSDTIGWVSGRASGM